MPAVKEAFAAQQLADDYESSSPFVMTSADSATPRKMPTIQRLDIIDIRGAQVDFNLKEDITGRLNPVSGHRTLPTMLLYDEKGLQLFEDITYLDEYYLTNYEIELLKKHAAEMASLIPAGAMLVELGSGNLRKISLVLDAFEKIGKPIDYYALDLSEQELQRTLLQIPDYKHVRSHGLWGTYDDGKDWLKQFAHDDRSIVIIHLGSSIGNFSRDEAGAFLQGFAQVMKPTDSVIIGIDSCCDPDKVYFIHNGLRHANDIYGTEVFHLEDWKVIGEFIYDEDGGRHQAFLSPTKEVTVLGTTIKQAETLKIEQSLKYSQVGVEKLWRAAGLKEVKRWRRGDDYGLHLLQKTDLPFSSLPSQYGSVLPTLQDWSALWQAWDVVTKGMLSSRALQSRPIKLRNACVFYLGHIPTFLDLQLSKVTGSPSTEPAALYQSIFERGIDPDVDNPEHCHAHSEIPDEWPPVEDIAAYQARVRARLADLYGEGESMPRSVARGVWVAFEHEAMHLETLLYMMLQSDRTLPPPHAPAPDFAALGAAARRARVPNAWVDVPAQTLTVGMDDPEDGTDPSVPFGWDNEKPSRRRDVHAFQAKARPITNEDYADYLYSTKNGAIPASWAIREEAGSSPVLNGAGRSEYPMQPYLRDKAVRTVYGLVPLQHALDWPVAASYDELAGCAAWMGGRIPTADEAQSVYAFAEQQKEEASMHSKLSNRVPAVNGHLVNDGVEETPPSSAAAQVNGSSSTTTTTTPLYIDLDGANVGFKTWHPQPVTAAGDALAGRAGMGGVWEWTSTPLARHDGFEPMPLYPAYTADFFDGKHNVVLGGSWATHPRIAGRRSFVNWYQRNYPYAWAGARLVRDQL
ncbi:DUF323 domain protein [Cordyceps fumosorosea ARSEF 2679]|uniref:DUF323 domain protein n=1 Tax=Cordyceps fumosorosea (strain ARSEF 2679) TaxID=1081104 RepID=A0A167RMG6_CORFA|nr:DUF323 domain protein [Cordyceps fumosorosea ARSEF 2679]OAA58739.1 DUF323 domain protein [Cordyceps fumosorosea ARSEF 2679]